MVKVIDLDSTFYLAANYTKRQNVYSVIHILYINIFIS